MSSNYPELGMDDPMPFGRHKGETVEWIIDNDPGWLAWVLDNLQTQFTTEVLLALQAAGY